MKATETLVKNRVFLTEDVNQHFNLDVTRDCYVKTQKDIVKSMKEYATLKCKELLEIVVEKVKVKNTLYYMDKDNIDTAFDFYSELDGRFEVDENSILNAVDLEKFCS